MIAIGTKRHPLVSGDGVEPPHKTVRLFTIMFYGRPSRQGPDSLNLIRVGELNPAQFILPPWHHGLEPCGLLNQNLLVASPKTLGLV